MALGDFEQKIFGGVRCLTSWPPRAHHLRGAPRSGQGVCDVEDHMPRTDLLEQSAPRAELDQRSREARLRLEQVERLWVARPLPSRSLLRRLLRRLRSRVY